MTKTEDYSHNTDGKENVFWVFPKDHRVSLSQISAPQQFFELPFALVYVSKDLFPLLPKPGSQNEQDR